MVLLKCHDPEVKTMKLWRAESDALALEYKLEYGYARGYLDLPDVMDDSPRFSIPGVFGYSFEKQPLYFGRIGEGSPLFDDGSDARLV